MAKKRTINNYNAMRPALVLAHNTGNRRAITTNEIAVCGIQDLQFESWKASVKELYRVAAEYVTLKKNSRFNADITEEVLTKAYNKVFPKWKECLGAGEKTRATKELRVNPRDVEDLVGFVGTFIATANGTAEAIVSEQVFRRKVEALIGCAIAKNAILTDEEREAVEGYRGAIKSKASAEDKIAEIKTIIELRQKDITQYAENADLCHFLKKMLEADKAELKEAETRKANATKEIARLEKTAQAIEEKQARAK